MATHETSMSERFILFCVGANAKNLRELKGETKAQAAAGMGIEEHELSDFENGNDIASRFADSSNIAIRAAAYYEVPLCRLFSTDDGEKLIQERLLDNLLGEFDDLIAKSHIRLEEIPAAWSAEYGYQRAINDMWKLFEDYKRGV